MAVSRYYLDTLDLIGLKRPYESEPVDHLLAELKNEWKWLQQYWNREDEYLRDTKRTEILINLAEIGYELLAQLTGEDWNTLIAGAKELHEKKNSGYSPSDTDAWANFRMCTLFGIDVVDGVITRLCDKFTRFQNVYDDSTKDKVGESAIDTLKDFSAYCLIAVCLLEERNKIAN